MGRRSVHTPEELRQLILGASRGIIERDGLTGLSAREVARLIGYSAGTLYNIFDNLDDILLTLQAQILGELLDDIKSVPKSSDAQQYVEELAETYVNYALKNTRLWNLLFAHTLPPDAAVGSLMHEHMNAIISIVADAVSQLVPNRAATQVDKSVRTLVAGIHGITAIAVTSKAPTLKQETAQDYAKNLTRIFIRGLQAEG